MNIGDILKTFLGGYSGQPVAYTRQTRTPIYVDNNPNNVASYSPLTDSIGASSSFLNGDPNSIRAILAHEMIHKIIPMSLTRQLNLMQSPGWPEINSGLSAAGYNPTIDASKEVPAFLLGNGYIPGATLKTNSDVLNSLMPTLTDDQKAKIKKITGK